MKFEYKTIELVIENKNSVEVFERRLTELGDQHWELVQVFPFTELHCVAFFKRPVLEPDVMGFDLDDSRAFWAR